MITGPVGFRENVRRQAILERELRVALSANLAGKSGRDALLFFRAERFACAEQAAGRHRCVFSGASPQPPSGLMSRGEGGRNVHHLLGVSLLLDAAPLDGPAAIVSIDVTYGLEWLLGSEGW